MAMDIVMGIACSSNICRIMQMNSGKILGHIKMPQVLPPHLQHHPPRQRRNLPQPINEAAPYVKAQENAALATVVDM